MLINTHSYHSLRYGVLSPEKLVISAQKKGMDCVALTDINCVTGVFDFVLSALKNGIKPVVGTEFRNGNQFLFIAIAKNLKGFKEINELLSVSHTNHQPYPIFAPQFNDCYVIYSLKNYPKKLKHNEFIGIEASQINQLFKIATPTFLAKCVILQPCTISSRFNYELHCVLRAIDNNVLLDKLTPEQHCTLTHHIPHIDQLLLKFSAYPVIAQNTVKLLDDCSFDFDFKSNKNKSLYTDSKYNDKELLRKLSLQGVKKRYGNQQKEALLRVEKELQIIDQMGFCAYFLITWDIVKYSLSQGFYHVGRGSGANSVVAYCIGITDVDPIQLDLYFERFLNPKRSSPPDFDIDWSHNTRDHILDYIFERFGERHTAFVGTIGTFKRRSPIRELGKVYGLPKEEIDALTRTTQNNHHKDELVNKIHTFSQALEGKPNLRSMHSCGILISEAPITQYTAVEMLPKGYATAQIDMYIAEEIGLEKLDILSQRGLSSIDATVRAIEKNKGERVNIHRVEEFKTDAKINKKLASGETIGCFYIESPAMRGLLRRLKCDNYFTLVAASSVIRPGVAQSGMMREFILRHNNPKSTKYLHPLFEKHLGETYGIMVYQEDVIKIAHHFGGLDLGVADVLRRAMSGKTRSKSEFENVKAQYFNNCKNLGYTDELAHEVYRQIESFAGYSFCKAHSASYSVESYQSLYLKTYYPLEFIVGVINNFGGFYRTEVYVHEAKMSGGNVQLPCVNNSSYFTDIDGHNIYLGFIHIERLEQHFKKLIATEREKNGYYTSLEDFIHRTNISYEQLKQLIYVGALRFTGKSKAEIIIESKLIINNSANTKGALLFTSPVKKFTLPKLSRSKLEDAYDEIDVLGFPVSLTTFQLINFKLHNLNYVRELNQLNNKMVTMVGMLISIKDVPTARGHMNFGTWIDEEGRYFDTTHFPNILKKYPFLGAGCYALYGKVVVDFHFPSIEIIKMKKLPLHADPRYAENMHKSILPKAQELSGKKLPRAPYPTKQQVNQLYNR